MKIKVNVRRIVREDTFIEVEADTVEEGIEKAKEMSSNVEADKWECYDCKVWVDDDDYEII